MISQLTTGVELGQAKVLAVLVPTDQDKAQLAGRDKAQHLRGAMTGQARVQVLPGKTTIGLVIGRGIDQVSVRKAVGLLGLPVYMVGLPDRQDQTRSGKFDCIKPILVRSPMN